MASKWQKRLVKIGTWVAAEVVLTMAGADNLADYSEFVFSDRGITQVTEAISNLITLVL
ncbi:MAG: hypothetical protein KME17_22000 [Cyanosarcina radialis HA8281-LM2]|jgi:hypothetical protein|nr:hypothetical protein [Cyanosarcina radialis HA8281-LM2]